MSGNGRVQFRNLGPRFTQAVEDVAPQFVQLDFTYYFVSPAFGIVVSGFTIEKFKLAFNGSPIKGWFRFLLLGPGNTHREKGQAQNDVFQ